MRPPIVAALAAFLLSACVDVVSAPDPSASVSGPVASAPVPDRVTASDAVANFRAAASRVEPVAERICRERAPEVNCDFLILADPNRDAEPNAYQSLDPRGRPVLTFTRALIADTRNQDEIAFVIGHESAHHIEQHIAQQRRTAEIGASIGGLIGVVLDRGDATVDQLSGLGAQFGARIFSKSDELQADALGTVITKLAGYDPIRGAAFFARIPDPGDRFLGTHPPNAARIDIVRRTAAGL